MRRALALAGMSLLTLATALPAAAAGSDAVQVARLLKPLIAAVRNEDGGVPVLLPTTMPLGGPDHTQSSATTNGYDLEIATSAHCAGANVCLLGDFQGFRLGGAGMLDLTGARVQLRGGRVGHFSNVRCGATCSPAEIAWVQGGVLYRISSNPTVTRRPNAPAAALRRILVAAADQAIAAGPR
jgi:hypothetical protein